MNTKEKVLDLASGYKVKYKDNLCATYVSALSISLGLTDIVPPE